MCTFPKAFDRPFVLILCLFFFLVTVSMAQSGVHIQSMKLLAPDVGWTTTDKEIFWTMDGGNKWKNITPKLGAEQSLDSVFFLDQTTGWVVLVSEKAAAAEPTFVIARTTDAGVSWSTTPLVVPGLDPTKTTLSGGTHVMFIDRLHGWMNIPAVSGAAFRLGILLASSDGGRNWDWVPDSPGVSGAIRFVTPNDGWLEGGSDHSLYVTHDASRSWRKLSLKPPRDVGAAIYPAYDLPTFIDDRNALLPVTYSGAEGAGVFLALFSTADAGNDWKLVRLLPNLPESYAGAPFPSAISESALVTVYQNKPSKPALASVTADGRVETRMVQMPVSLAVRELSFITRDRGWLLADGKVLSSSDAGNTWRDITPGPESNRTFEISPEQRTFSVDGVPLTNTAVDLSLRIGFHLCQAPSSTIMQTLWNSSPFFDLGVYIGGASLSCSNPNLTAGWVSSVQNQGWGLMPLWVGPQAPCACWPAKSTKNNCVPFPHVFSTNPTTAQTQGVSEANSAVTAATKLGISPATYRSILYYDLEQYSSSQCGAAATAFVNGWVYQLNSSGYGTGVYGAPANAATDWKTGVATYPPENVWIAKEFSNSPSSPVVTIWGLSPLCDPYSTSPCTLWSDNERIHQYLGNQKESYGGTNLTIDYDIVDASIFVPPTELAKSYNNYAVMAIASGANSTTPTAINDVGTVAGYADLGASGVQGCPSNWCGFVYSSGNFTWAQYQVQGQYTDTYFTGINDAGTVVGYAGLYGFSYSGGNFTALMYPGAYATTPEAINDDGIVVGTWGDSSGGAHGFVEYGGKYLSYDYPGAQATEFNSINGDGQIVGSYYTGNGTWYSFLYNLPTATLAPAINYPNATYTRIYGINNNGQTAGVAELANGTWVDFLYDENSSSFLALPPSIVNTPIALNDQTQLIGGIGSGAYVATPQ